MDRRAINWLVAAVVVPALVLVAREWLAEQIERLLA